MWSANHNGSENHVQVRPIFWDLARAVSPDLLENTSERWSSLRGSQSENKIQGKQGKSLGSARRKDHNLVHLLSMLNPGR